MLGTIKLYSPARGYGFLIPDAPGLQDQFFHCSSVPLPRHELEDVLLPGTRVQFERGTGPDGRDRAVNVRPLKATMVDLKGNHAPTGRYSGFIED